VNSFTEPSAWPTLERAADASQARAPVAGVVAQVRVAAGDSVVAGQPLICIEAMKMEMWLTATAAGTVSAVHARLQDSVAAGTVLVELEMHP
jgi:geranyl-CoA carboxylase alpha subunit